MNKDAIKKALRYCASDSIADCKACPYANNGPFACSISMYKDALTLITEQENEVERLRTTLRQCNTELNNALESLKSQCREIGELKAENDNLNRDYRNAFERLISQQQEIERLKDDYAKLQELFAQYQMASDKEIRVQIKQAKIDVLNRLKSLSIYDDNYLDGYVFIDDIDKLLEELKK